MMNIFWLDTIIEKPGILFRDGKINTVVAVLFIIFAGLCLFLFFHDRKVSRLGKKADSLGKTNQNNLNSKP